MSDTNIYNGCCNEEMEKIKDNTVDIIICDLPYGQTNCQWDTCINLELMWQHFLRIKKPNTPVFMFCNTKFGASLINTCPKKLSFRYDIVWNKLNAVSFLLAHVQPMRVHESIYVFYEKKPIYNTKVYHKQVVKINQDRVRKNDSCYGTLKSECDSKYDPLLPRSILTFKNVRGVHSTQKPVPLLEHLIKYYSKEGDTCLDATMGSGSTGVASINLNRNFIGIEKDPDIFKIAQDRLAGASSSS